MAEGFSACLRDLRKLWTILDFLTLDSLVNIQFRQLPTQDTVSNLDTKETLYASTQHSLNNIRLQPKLLALDYLKLKLNN